MSEMCSACGQPIPAETLLLGAIQRLNDAGRRVTEEALIAETGLTRGTVLWRLGTLEAAGRIERATGPTGRRVPGAVKITGRKSK